MHRDTCFHMYMYQHTKKPRNKEVYTFAREELHTCMGELALATLWKDSRVSLFKQGQDLDDLSIDMTFLTLRNTKAALLDWRFRKVILPLGLPGEEQPLCWPLSGLGNV